MEAIEEDQDVIARGVVAPAEAAFYGLRLRIVAADGEEEVAVVIDDFESCLLGWRLSFIGVELDKIRKPFASLPGGVVEAAVDGGGMRVESVGVGNFFLVEVGVGGGGRNGLGMSRLSDLGRLGG